MNKQEYDPFDADPEVGATRPLLLNLVLFCVVLQVGLFRYLGAFEILFTVR